MDPRIHARLTDDIIAQAAAAYGLQPADLRLLDGFESFIYEAGQGDEAFILRLGHDSRRPPDLVRGELDFINAAAAGGAGVALGASVARGLPALSGDFVTPIPDGHGGNFVAAAFARAPGRPPWQAGWTPGRLEGYGRLIGRLHAVSRDYVPGDPAWRRPHWDGPLMDQTLSILPPDDAVIRERYVDLLATIRALPRTPDTYGLIHYDPHEGNFFMTDDGRITLFDFDDCCYHWYAADIAMVVFYKVAVADDPAAQTAEFLPHFLRGYRAEFDLDPAWAERLPLFLTLREIDLYAAIRHDLGETPENAWAARWMDGRRERLQAGVPYLAVDFTPLANV
jgi:Ser/Thr protein kinase RdoA (MazF antagonist)